MTYKDIARYAGEISPAVSEVFDVVRPDGLTLGDPNYVEATVTCACGNTFKAGSVKDEIKVEICSECHPFYTGKQKNIEAGGRIDKFKKRFKMD